jgi:PTH1 family peptidyl-tRNA hydrolase
MIIDYAIIVLNMNRKFNKNEISAVFGIGNPEEQFSGTFHNCGIQCIDMISGQVVNDVKFKKHSSGYFSYIKFEDIVLAKSLKYMNESGVVAKKIVSFFKIHPDNLAVIHDDSDLIIGKWKIDFDRSAAGHKGVQSIISALGTQKIWRIRIGIRQPNETRRQKADEFVLSRISTKDASILKTVAGEIAKTIVG